MKAYLWMFAAFCAPLSCAQPKDSEFTIALPDHNGQVRWQADGFKVVQISVKVNGSEIGLRGQSADGKLTLLGFAFLFPEQAPLTSEKCLNGVVEPLKKANSALNVSGRTEIPRAGGIPVSAVSFGGKSPKGPLYSVRAF